LAVLHASVVVVSKDMNLSDTYRQRQLAQSLCAEAGPTGPARKFHRRKRSLDALGYPKNVLGGA
jgi:hypothetical protein